VYGDNLSVLAIAENLCYHERTKHFDIKHHYIHEQITNKNIVIKYLPTAKMTADIFTKALPKTSSQNLYEIPQIIVHLRGSVKGRAWLHPSKQSTAETLVE
jgi:hypothetical protein